jgi:hypothetical protein
MNREILQKIITNFSVDEFVEFFREKNRSFSPLKEDFAYYNDDNFNKGLKLGEIKFSESEKLVACAFQVVQPLSERSGKKAQYEKGKKILKDTQADAGIFIFYDESGNFRFSLIYANYLGKRRDWNNFRRFTYFVSKELTNKTFIRQIGDADFSTLEKIKGAFSVDSVRKQFYSEIQGWYFWAMDKISFPDDYKYNTDHVKDKDVRNATNLIRLITRIIFIWFLIKKELVPIDLFSKKKLKGIVLDFMEDEKASNFYNAILQNLFFGTLNQKMNERKFIKESDFLVNKEEYGVKNIYRYGDKFLISKDEVLKLFKDVPFLNGGLFDCLDKEDDTGKVIYIDGFSRNPSKQATMPDYLFFQQKDEVVNLSQYGLGKHSVRGLIEILNSYNFTIDENTPIDQEIALDPELLGKVFENLLASYNPETATTARRATGSYYTPREIVDYMVETSLFEYLKGKFPEIDKEKLKILLSYSDEVLEFTIEEKQKLILAIDDIKIIDPACGSGAFPMGILHKLVFSLQKLDPENKYWHELQYQKALKESKEVFKYNDKDQREERLKEINETFDEGINYPDYARKLYLIENCIYGVDIQPIAIQISKLRFFISLVIDQKADARKENLGIRALPNLETKFVSANTLIGLDKPLYYYPEIIEKLENDIKSLRHKYFQAKTRKEKLDYQNKDRQLRMLFLKELERIGFPSDSSKKIAKFDPYDQNASADFFDPEWMFGVISGFDIVIGNPPYIKEYTSKSAFNGLRSLPCYQGKIDIWYLFACKGIDLLQKNGVLTLIAQNNWVTNYGASKMRGKIIKNTKIVQTLDFGSYMIFESSSIQTMIMIFKFDSITDNYQFDYRKLEGNNINFNDVLDLLNFNQNSKAIYLSPVIQRNKLKNEPLIFNNKIFSSILEKLLEQSNFKLAENELTQGIVTPQDYVIKDHLKIDPNLSLKEGIFIINNEEKNSIMFCQNELELIKPWYTTKELRRYYANKNNTGWIIYTDYRFKYPNNIKGYPNIKKHLDKFQKVITSHNRPYGIHRARNEDFFKGEKIISVRKCSMPTFTYSDFDCYVSATFYIIKSRIVNLKYLTALLNSKLIAFWLKHKGKMQGNNYQIDKDPLLKLPLKNIPETEQKPFIEIVNYIISAYEKYGSILSNESLADINNCERQIDSMVYGLYGLLPKEIKIIEEDLK